jgi:hypothetical protein
MRFWILRNVEGGIIGDPEPGIITAIAEDFIELVDLVKESSGIDVSHHNEEWIESYLLLESPEPEAFYAVDSNIL